MACKLYPQEITIRRVPPGVSLSAMQFLGLTRLRACLEFSPGGQVRENHLRSADFLQRKRGEGRAIQHALMRYDTLVRTFIEKFSRG